MKAYPYMPFQGQLETLQGADLSVLKDVAEGWYVDYKESLPSLKDLARHLSAFANEHGGWLFLGVKEGKGKTMTAESFPGVESDSVPAVLVSLREAAAANVNPPVYFETKEVRGPATEIGLPSGRSVVIVGIPQGTIPPYVHSSGRIYRRVADQSDPKPETDRYVLDQLWHRSAETRRRLEDLLTERPSLWKDEAAGSLRAYVHFLADPHFLGHQFELPYERFVEIMESSPADSVIKLPFPNTFPSGDGFVARHVADNNPFSEVLTFRWQANGNVRVSIPVNVHDFARVESQLDASQLAFLDAIRKQGFRGGNIAEFSMFFAILIAVTEKYLRIREILGITDSFYGKVVLRNAWRAVPFVNLPWYLKEIHAHGFPVIQDETLICPPGLTAESLVEMNELSLTDVMARPIITVVRLVVATMEAAGINLREFMSDGDLLVNEFGDALNEAVKVKPIR